MDEKEATKLLNELKNGLDISKLESRIEKDKEMAYSFVGGSIGISLFTKFNVYVFSFFLIIAAMFFLKAKLLTNKVKKLNIVLNAVILTKLENTKKFLDEALQESQEIIDQAMTPEFKKILEVPEVKSMLDDIKRDKNNK